MKKVHSCVGMALAILAALLAFAGCSQPTVQKEAEAEEEAIPFEGLVAGLDGIGGTGARSLLPASSIIKPDGSAFAPAELDAYLDGIRVALANYVKSIASSPYAVLPVRLRSEGQSGLMWVPLALGRKLPVIAFQHGTQIYRGSAPSRFDPNPLSILASPDIWGAFQNYVECTTAALMASAGYIVVMPDYPGYGDSQAPHPYVHLSLGESVLLMLNRAKAVLASPFASAHPNGRIFLTGYSEGGFATMAAARTLQGKMNVVAAVPCAGSYDLAGAMVDDMLADKEAIVPYYVPFTAYGYASVYGSVEPSVWNLQQLFLPPLPALIPQFFSGNETGAMITAQLPTKVIKDFITEGLRADLAAKKGQVYARLCENTVYLTSWKPAMVIQMIHCPDDDIVPVANAVNTYVAWHSPQTNLPNVLPPIFVPPVPLPDSLASIADIHVRAYPTAMVAAFTFIQTANAMY
jgi:pimeloyl-ACP methyl ester carboxylesterase